MSCLVVEFGVNYENWLTVCRNVSLGDPSRRMFDDGAGTDEE
jgi:hypothetical protein